MSIEREHHRLPRLLTVLRDTWTILGITLLFFLLLEGGARLWLGRTHRNRLAPRQDESLNPYAGQAWWPVFLQQLVARHNRFDPYRGWRLEAQHGPGLTVDTAGIRLTVPAPKRPPTLRVVMLGGSSMWGLAVRDSFTIPSLTARKLQELGYDDVEVVNLATPGYNVLQEATTALVEIAHGRRIDAAVVLDGYNDMELELHYADVARAYGEENTQARLELGSRGFWAELLGLGRHSVIVKKLSGTPLVMRSLGQCAPDAMDPSLCGPLAGYYGRVIRALDAIGREYGFPTLVFQQPIDATSGKRLSAWEKSFGQKPERYRAFRTCAESIDSVMAPELGRSYFPLYTMFDQDTATVFEDWNSHMTEQAHARVADRIVQQLVPVLARRRTVAMEPR